ncbi:MAG: hypothetical protein JSU82_13090 [Rhodospirillales bacterium]|nr:MAG: hypothetical protein JSU82_13090 [Rhodospirillales bacterium]
MTRYSVPYAVMIAVLVALFALPVRSAELVLFESSGCVWCQAWDAQIGEIYPKAPEAQIAPLRRVDIDQERPADLAELRGIIYTPTFVLMDEGREIGRITGYAGEEFFWGLLGIELKKLGDRAATVTRLSGMPGASLDQQGEDK